MFWGRVLKVGIKLPYFRMRSRTYKGSGSLFALNMFCSQTFVVLTSGRSFGLTDKN